MSRRWFASVCLTALVVACVAAPVAAHAIVMPASTFERYLAPGFLLDIGASGGGVSGSHLVYADTRVGNTDIYCYDLSTGAETRITDEAAYQYRPAISGDTIVWEDFRDWGTSPNIWSYNLTTHVEERISKSPSTAEHPRISGRKVVWEADHDAVGFESIYMYDLDTGVQTRVSPVAANQADPSISGDNIAWTDYRNGQSDVYFYRISNGALLNLSNTSSLNAYGASASGNYIVWLDHRDGGNAELYGYNVYTGATTRITNDTVTQNKPDIDGTKVVWSDSRLGNLDIYCYDFVAQRTVTVCLDSASQASPYISGANIIWEDRRSGVSQIWTAELNVPHVTAAIGPTTVAYDYKGTLKASGSLVTPGGTPIAGGQVRIELSATGDYWISASPTGFTDADGHFSLTSNLMSLYPRFSSARYFRVDFLGATGRLSAQSDPVKVKPRASLGKPVAPSTMLHTKSYTVYGSLAPRHTAGPDGGVLMCYRKESGHWKLRKSFALGAVDHLADSRYTASVKLTQAGSWRMRVKHSDSDHATTYSAWRYTTVK